MNKKLFSLLLALMAGVGTMSAGQGSHNGIYYYLYGKYLGYHAKVIAPYNGTKYTGTIDIPSSFVYDYDGGTYTVDEIDQSAFSSCTGLVSVTLPNTITTIGKSAFSGCTGVTTISIPSSVSSIGNYAFGNVLNIVYNGTATGAPWGARSMNGYVDGLLVYNDASKTTLLACSVTATGEITIPNSVTSIADKAFQNCSGLTSVTIPNGVTSIGGYAFYGCSSLTSVTIPNSVTSIGENAFSGVINIVYNGTATGAPWGARSMNGYLEGLLVYSDASKTTVLACSSLATGEIVIPNSVTNIGDWAFSGCGSLTSVAIPSSVTSIGKDAFNNCYGLTRVRINDLAAWCSISFINNNNFLYNGGNPLGYAHHLYLDNTEIKQLTIPNGVTSIGDYAFYSCSGLTSVTIPNSVTSIGKAAFYECSGLTNATIGNGVTSIGDDAFCLCSSLASVTIGNSVTSIGTYAFNSCSGMTSVTIGNGITSIGNNAFYGCSGLTSVHISDLAAWCDIIFSNNTSNPLGYARHLYLDNTEITDLVIPNSVTNIKDYSFYGCSGLISVTIPNSVTWIGDGAFFDCTGLTSVHISDLTAWCSIYFDRNWAISNPLYYAHNLYLNNELVTDVVIPDGITSIHPYAFEGCSSMVSVTIPNSVTSIGYGAFSGCSSMNAVHISDMAVWCSIYYQSSGTSPLYYAHNLYLNNELITDLVIPDCISCVQSYSFEGWSSLNSVTIPNSVTYIGNNAFYECSGLTSVTVEATTPPSVYSYSFPANQRIYVPIGTLAAYKSTNWNNFDLRVFDLVAYEGENSPTSFTASLGDNVTGQYIASCGMEGGETFAGNTIEYIGLDPESEYQNIPLFAITTGNDYLTTSISFTTSALTLTTQPSKTVSSNTAILLAETNMADAEVSCGFEWKRNDAPEDFEATKVFCPVANGTMAGRLKGLKDDVYYKYRAFYQSAAGNMYYGDWKYIFTGDNAVEFDPVLYTYPASAVTETEATLKGYALEGSDDFNEQGFEYWADSRVIPNNAPVRKSVIGDKQRIAASGIAMKVTLTDLDEGTVYKYRTYAQIGDQTVYGAEMSFTTKGEYQEPTAIDEIVNDKMGKCENMKILRDGQLFILREGKTYNAQGARVE